MTTPRWLSITVLLLCACPADDDGTTGNDTGSSSSTSPTTSTTTTEASSESTTLTTTDASTSTDAESSTAADESTTAADESSSSTTEPVAFEIMSMEFENDGPLPHTAHIDGGNQSPDLEWVGAPAGTMSFGVYLHDLDFQGGNPDGFPHAAIWNIPGDVMELPHDVDHDPMPADVPGAVQCQNWTDMQYGYGGPGSPANHYEFVLFAIDVADLSAEIDQDSSLEDVWTALNAHSLGTATIVGQSTGP